jgi:hypothetical protein
LSFAATSKRIVMAVAIRAAIEALPRRMVSDPALDFALYPRS